jgi:integrase
MYMPAGYYPTSRGDEYVIPGPLIPILIEAASGVFKDMLTVLALTGARPGEVCNAEHYHFRKAEDMLFFDRDPSKGYRHKNARNSKRQGVHRRIYLPDQVVPLVATAASKRSWLFPNRLGNPFDNQTFYYRFQRLRDHQKVREWADAANYDLSKLIPYSFRHTYITQALVDGVNIKDIADLVGNSVATIEKHYAHATTDRQAVLRRIAKSR